ncbi:putative bifunctional diguanylate cyclase/phosphodiesterase [Jannaschia sp. R86511]|uniref:putative bifunctional diguanylate cyclase/phosphodiesterase n=1 Tax=Jannaschia sp. R86511 TaxID=3093853 RepID=UPI0036D3AF51
MSSEASTDTAVERGVDPSVDPSVEPAVEPEPRRGLAWLPRGTSLPAEDWRRRHRSVLWVLGGQAALLPLAALVLAGPDPAVLLSSLVPLLMTGVARLPRLPRQVQAAVAGLGLVVVSAVVVQVSGGVIEAHFHFFVMIGVVALYESWWPFGLAVAFVLAHHGVIGTLFSDAVYNHDGARQDPWLWAGVHAALFGFACLGSIVNWRLHEGARSVEQQLHGDLAQQARVDELTGLPNRAALHEHAERLIERAVRDGRPLTVLMVDLDRFKLINDTLGHAWGDALLREVGPRLGGGLREGDVLARLGGDEFAALLPGLVAEQAMDVAERLRERLRAGFVVDGIDLDVDASVGVATFDPRLEAVAAPATPSAGAAEPSAGAAERSSGPARPCLDDLLRRADVAMYAAKRSGSGALAYSSREDDHSRSRLALLSDLRRAIAERQLVLHFQPKLDMSSGRVSGAEALVRWHHPERGLLMPADFVADVESTGLALPFTDLVLDLAMAQVRRWRDEGRPIQVAVNVPPRCLLDPEFPDRVAGLLRRRDLPASALRIEVTESSLMTDPAAVLQTMLALSAQGVGLSIDDFGTGYSSLTHLRELPVDELKVDRSFTLGMTSSTDDAVIVRSAVELGHRLGLAVVAEGVEDDDTLAALHQESVDVVQGYLFARPMTAAAMDAWLADRDQAQDRQPDLGPDLEAVPGQRAGAGAPAPAER